MTTEDIREQFPFIRQGLEQTVWDVLELHNKKNHDYDGNSPLSNPFGLETEFTSGVWRKVVRIAAAVKGGTLLVSESLIETSRDLVVYALMWLNSLERNKTK